MINNKAQGGGILAFILGYIIVFIVWVTWAYKLVSYWGQQAIINASLTGIKAFFFANLNLFIAFGFILGLILLVYGGRQ